MGEVWTDLAEERERERDEWWAVVNTVMNLRVPLRVENFLTSGGSIGFKKIFCSMGLVVLTVCLPRWFLLTLWFAFGLVDGEMQCV